MRGNFGPCRQTLAQRNASRRRQNDALAVRDRAHRCPTCRAPLGTITFTVFGRPEKYCRALCVPTEAV